MTETLCPAYSVLNFVTVTWRLARLIYSLKSGWLAGSSGKTLRRSAMAKNNKTAPEP